MKYEIIFGDERLFDGASEFVEVIRFNDYSRDYLWGDLNTIQLLTFEELKAIPIVAMRRIIQEPKRWTVEDQKAGRLPEVGSKAMQVQGFCVVDVLSAHHGYVVVCNSEINYARPVVFEANRFLELFTPIETPEEKAERLRSEWIQQSCYDLVQPTEKAKELAGFIYDALLSGALSVPTKGGE